MPAWDKDLDENQPGYQPPVRHAWEKDLDENQVQFPQVTPEMRALMEKTSRAAMSGEALPGASPAMRAWQYELEKQAPVEAAKAAIRPIGPIAAATYEGATLGLGPKLVVAPTYSAIGKVTGVTPDFTEGYKEALGAWDKYIEDYRKEQPTVGGYFGPVGLTKTTASLPISYLLGTAASKIPWANLLTRGPTSVTKEVLKSPFRKLIERAGTSAAEQAVIGGVTGLGEARGGLGAHVASGTIGGTIGGILGGATPLATGTTGALIRTAKGVFQTPESAAIPAVAESLIEEANITSPQQLASTLAALDPEGRLADLIPASTAAFGTTPGKGGRIIQEGLRSRQAGQLGRFQRALESGMGKKASDYLGSLDELIEARKTETAPLYDIAFKSPTPVDSAPVLGSIDVQLKTAKGPIKKTLEAARSFMFDNEGRPDVSIEGLHNAKMAIDDILYSGRLGDEGIGATSKRKLSEIRDLLNGQLREASPEYAQANDLFSSASKLKEAQELGRNFLKEDTADLKRQVGKMTEVDKDAFLQGAIADIMDGLSKTREDQDVIKRLTRDKIEKLKVAFPSERAFKDFAKFLESEKAIAETTAMTLGGSRTAPLKAGQERAQVQTDIIAKAAEIKRPFGSVSRFLGAPERQQAIAQALMQERGPEREALISAIARELEKQTAPQPQGVLPRTRAIAGLLSTLGGRMAGVAGPNVAREFGGQ